MTTEAVKVIDRICGAGKTTWMFSEMNKRYDERWIYVSPYLSEVGDSDQKGRIQKELPDLKFQSPDDQFSKVASLDKLLRDGQNVAITHQLYLSMTKSMFETIRQQEYNLVVDETLDLISIFNVDKTDIELLISGNHIKELDNGLLKWTAGSNYNGRFKDIKKLCDLEVLHIFRSSHKDNQDSSDIFMCKLPPRLMTACKQKYVLTYMFYGSIMEVWMNLHEIGYEYYNPKGIRPSSEIKKIVRKNLHILKTPRKIHSLHFNSNGGYKPYTFSKNWFRTNAEAMDTLSTALDSAVRNYFPRKKKVYYTTFKDYQDCVTKGSLHKALALFDFEEMDIQAFSDTFVAKNQRASNQYSEYNCAVHVCNTYPPTRIESYISHLGHELDRDAYATSELVQWIFRGSIRKNKPMYVLVASIRMKQLLESWLSRGY